MTGTDDTAAAREMLGRIFGQKPEPEPDPAAETEMLLKAVETMTELMAGLRTSLVSAGFTETTAEKICVIVAQRVMEGSK